MGSYNYFVAIRLVSRLNSVMSVSIWQPSFFMTWVMSPSEPANERSFEAIRPCCFAASVDGIGGIHSVPMTERQSGRVPATTPANPSRFR